MTGPAGRTPPMDSIRGVSGIPTSPSLCSKGKKQSFLTIPFGHHRHRLHQRLSIQLNGLALGFATAPSSTLAAPQDRRCRLRAASRKPLHPTRSLVRRFVLLFSCMNPHRHIALFFLWEKTLQLAFSGQPTRGCPSPRWSGVEDIRERADLKVSGKTSLQGCAMTFLPMRQSTSPISSPDRAVYFTLLVFSSVYTTNVSKHLLPYIYTGTSLLLRKFEIPDSIVQLDVQL
ncbi:hypothetical protein IWX90DRAFT_44035 [Phyllosticta citrichinensis]|uniref:Uncharacterized protein n=1 Tax=Phyllosticta citrichinensis TaxID=1130410 RepID=A0ABR1Y996_9PEZI